MHMHGNANTVCDASRSHPIPDRRAPSRRRTGRLGHRRTCRCPSVRCLAPPRNSLGAWPRPDAPRWTTSTLLPAPRSLPGHRSMGDRLPPPLGRATRSPRCGAGQKDEFSKEQHERRRHRMSAAAARAPRGRKTFSIERMFSASVEDVWTLWTTKAGIESWWGPEGFEVTVTSLDLRLGGELIYIMTASAPEQVAFMKRAGMPLSTEARVTYTEVSPPSRLAYRILADFVPDVAPYEVATVVDMQAEAEGAKLTVTFDAMHDDLWTERARASHESQMRKLDALLAARGKAVRS